MVLSLCCAWTFIPALVQHSVLLLSNCAPKATTWIYPSGSRGLHHCLHRRGVGTRAPQFSARGNCWRVSTFPTLRAQVRILTAPEASTQRASMQKLRALDNNHATFSHASFTIKRLVKRKLCNLSQTVESYLHLCFCSFRTSADSVSPRFPLNNHGGCFFLAAF